VLYEKNGYSYMSTTSDLQKNTRALYSKMKIFLLYFFLLSGGLWHLVGKFQKIMQMMASSLLIILTIWIFWEVWTSLFNKHKNHNNAIIQQQKYLYIIWSVFVIIASIFIEWIGVKTGIIFGSYRYGPILKPFIDKVPVAIGFAWLGMLLSSISVSQKLFQKPYLIIVIFAALFMTIFDFFMEPAAIKLHYWKWTTEIIPFQNYLAWFIISLFFILVGFKLKLFNAKINNVPFHAYFAQLGYFLLVHLS